MQTFNEGQLPELRFLPNPAGLATAHSIDEAVSLVGASLSPHRLKVRERAQRVAASLSALNLGDCVIASLKYGFDVEIDAGRISDYFMFKLTLSGSGRMTSDDRCAVTSPDTIVITSPQARTHFLMSSSCRHITTRVCRRTVEERLMQKLGRPLHEPLEFELEIASETTFGRAWWRLISHICEVSANSPSVMACTEIRAQYSRTIIELLLHAAPHRYTAALHQSEGQLSPRHVRRAREYIEAHLAGMLHVADIAAAIGVSPRTLQNGFKQTFSMSPIEYIRHARVKALHRALLRADGSQSVTSLMTSVGIMSFGRYADYYRKQIGVVPSVTLRRAN